MRPHSAKVWSLELEGPMAADDVLLSLPDLPNLEVLELHDSNLHGWGLSALARFPKLRIVRVREVADDLSIGDAPKLEHLEEITFQGLPPSPCGIESWADRLPSLRTLSLGARSDLHLAGPLPKRIGHLTLTGVRVEGDGRLPNHAQDLSLRLSEQCSDALEQLLAGVFGVESLSLRGTPVGDALVARLVSRWQSLRYLDVVGTKVSETFLREVTIARPTLRMHPVPRLPDITAEQVAQMVEQQLSRPVGFVSFHGIEPHTLEAALVKPHSVIVTPRDDESAPRRMWAIMREADGHLVVFDPEHGMWLVVQRQGDVWVEIMAANTLTGALTPMA